MAYFNETSSRHAYYLESQERWYKQEARQVLEQMKEYIRAGEGDELEFRPNFPLRVITDVLARARAHLGKQALLLGSSSHNELCAKLVATAIGLDEQADLGRDEIVGRINYLVEAVEECKTGGFPAAPWAQIALMAALRAISSAAV